MWYLKKFLCCVHLYYGVLFISLSGLLLSIMVAIWIYLMDIVEKSLIIGLIAIFLLILYILGKLFLIIGTITVSQSLRICRERVYNTNISIAKMPSGVNVLHSWSKHIGFCYYRNDCLVFP